jgi:hypothetical protein
MGFDMGQMKNIGDLKDVWGNVKEKNWKGLYSAIRKTREEKGDSETLDKAEQAAHKAEGDGEQFPDNPMQLSSMLGSRM